MRARAPADRLALLPWGDVIEDYLDPIGVPFSAFRDEMTGGWLFGYVEALKTAGIATVIVCVSAREAPGVYTHAPSGAEIRVIGVGPGYLRLRRHMRDPYGWSFERMFGRPRRYRRLLRVVRDVAPYLPTPLGPLVRVLSRTGASMMLCQEYESPRFDVCVAAGRLLRIPVFATFQGGDYHLSRLERVVRAWTLRASAGLVVGPAAEVARIRRRYGLPPEMIARIPNPLDTREWRPDDRAGARAALGLPRDARVVAWHGRVDVQAKGLDVLVDAWRLLRRRLPDADLRLLLVGGGADAPELDVRLASVGAEGVHCVRDYLVDPLAVRRHLSAADVYAFPSRHEGLPVAPMEAMACGLPVVAADARGAADLLPRGERDGGLLFPAGDAEALAAALGDLLSRPEHAASLGALARERVESDFALEPVGARLREFFAARSAAVAHRSRWRTTQSWGGR